MVCSMINHASKIIMFWSAKSACTTIKNMMFYYESSGRILPRPLDIHHIRGGYNEVPFQSLRDGKFKDYTLIVVVRNPYTRFCSANLYNAKLENTDPALYITKMYPEKYKTTHHLELQSHGIDLLGERKFDHAFDISQLDQVNAILSARHPNLTPFQIRHLNDSGNTAKYGDMIKHYKAVIEEYYKSDIRFITSLALEKLCLK